VDDSLVDPGTVVIAGEKGKCWRWAAVWIALATIVVPVAAVIASDSYDSSKSLVIVASAIWFGVVVLGLAHAGWWYFGPGSTVYECDGQVLRAVRGSRLMAEVQCDGVQALALSRGLTWRSITLTEAFPPNTPYLKLLLDDEAKGSSAFDFPPILIWSNEKARSVSVALSRKAGVPNKEV
jgi:hypothetical protein